MRVRARSAGRARCRPGVITQESSRRTTCTPTSGALAEAPDKVPTDRRIDGVDALEFLLGESENGCR